MESNEMIVFKFYRPDDRDLSVFIRLMTDNHYTVTFDRPGTKNLICKVSKKSNTIHCGLCKLTDGYIYTSNPPKVKCKVTGEYHLSGDICNCKNDAEKYVEGDESPKSFGLDVNSDDLKITVSRDTLTYLNEDLNGYCD